MSLVGRFVTCCGTCLLGRHADRDRVFARAGKTRAAARASSCRIAQNRHDGIEQFLSATAQEFRAQGLLYPISGRPANSPEGHHNIAWQMGGDRRFRSSAGTLDDVASEISSFPGDAILSSEDFETILGVPDRFLPLLEHPLLKEHAFTIVLWVRDQASYLESLFFEMLG